MQVAVKKKEKDVLDAQKSVIELAQSIYALIKDEKLGPGFAKDALDVALVLKRRQLLL